MSNGNLRSSLLFYWLIWSAGIKGLICTTNLEGLASMKLKAARINGLSTLAYGKRNMRDLDALQQFTKFLGQAIFGELNRYALVASIHSIPRYCELHLLAEKRSVHISRLILNSNVRVFNLAVQLLSRKMLVHCRIKG